MHSLKSLEGIVQFQKPWDVTHSESSDVSWHTYCALKGKHLLAGVCRGFASHCSLIRWVILHFILHLIPIT